MRFHFIWFYGSFWTDIENYTRLNDVITRCLPRAIENRLDGAWLAPNFISDRSKYTYFPLCLNSSFAKIIKAFLIQFYAQCLISEMLMTRLCLFAHVE